MNTRFPFVDIHCFQEMKPTLTRLHRQQPTFWFLGSSKSQNSDFKLGSFVRPHFFEFHFHNLLWKKLANSWENLVCIGKTLSFREKDFFVRTNIIALMLLYLANLSAYAASTDHISLTLKVKSFSRESLLKNAYWLYAHCSSQETNFFLLWKFCSFLETCQTCLRGWLFFINVIELTFIDVTKKSMFRWHCWVDIKKIPESTHDGNVSFFSHVFCQFWISV